ncbi:MAG: heme-binding protein [Alphaproteobacteria bacterium]|nr:heme-binding protein [Alphaproteobacteria bacterium]
MKRLNWSKASKATAVLLVATGIGAQAPMPPAPPQLAPEKSIPLDQALAAAQAALAACTAKNSPATVEVMDLNQNVKVLLSGDGARTNSFEPARRKAYTVLKKGMSSGAFAKSVGSPPVNAVIEGDPNLRASAGGLPIVKGGAIIGALAVSSPTGQDTDEACAEAGIAKFHF